MARAGLGGLGVFLVVLATTAATVGAMLAVYQTYVRHNMQADVRHIMQEYVPLDSAPSCDPNDLAPGHGGGSSRGGSASVSRQHSGLLLPFAPEEFDAKPSGGSGRAANLLAIAE